MESLIERFGLAAGVVVAAAAIGLILDRLVVARVRAVARKQGWLGGEAVARSLRGAATMWLTLAALWWAVIRVAPNARTEQFLLRLLNVAIVLSVTVVAARLLGRMVRLYTDKSETPLPSTSIFVNLTRLAVLLLGGLIALRALGIEITPLLTALGVGGLAVALALQDTLGNLFAGLQIIASKQIRPGDFIRLQTGEEGWVEDVTWRITTMRQISNDLVIIPNSMLASSLITNFTKADQEHSVKVPVGVSYASDLDHVERVTLEVAREVMGAVEGGVAEWEPVVRFTGFGDSAIMLHAVLRARSYADQFPLQSEFVKRLHLRYAAESIEIPFPIRTVRIAEKHSAP